MIDCVFKQLFFNLKVWILLHNIFNLYVSKSFKTILGNALSNAERKRKYRERLSGNKCEEIKKADRARKALKELLKS